MKKILLSLLVTVVVLSLSAQTKSGYVPFHQYFLSNHGDIQKDQNGNSRNVTYAEIAYMHYAPINDSNWIYSDSGQFYFSQIIADTTPLYETGGTYFEFENVKWDTSGQFTSTANGLGSPLTVTGQIEDTATKVWSNSYLYTNTYSTINYLTTQLIQNWSGGAWVDSAQYSYTYNVSNYDSITVVQSGNPLQNDTQYLYIHNGYNTTEIITQIWSGSAWTNLYKQSNSFDANGNNYQSFVTVWNGTGWNNYALIIRGFDLNNELVSYVYELWNAGTGAYVNNYQEGYAWVLSNNTQFENYTWDTTTNSWTPISLNTYSYDGNHNVIYEFDQTYTNGAFVNGAQYYYYYQQYTVSGIKNLDNDLNISLYPNPSTGNAVISYAAKNAGSIILNIYNALGNLMNQQKSSILAGENQLPVNLTGYATGNYFVQVVDGASGKIGVLRMVKQ